jgi:subtilase family serine protease
MIPRTPAPGRGVRKGIPLRRTLISVAAVATATLTAAAGVATAAPAAARPAVASYRQVHSCTTAPRAGHVACNAILHQALTAAGTVEPAATTPSGYGPSDLRSAYTLTAAASSGGTGQTVGIVDAYDDPNAAADLATYRSQYGLPACTTASGCFRKVSQTGSSTSLPSKNGGWAQEESLDIDMASAICPNCKILLVEASSTSMANLGKAVNEAVALGATVVSNSYGGGESSSDTSYDSSYFKHPGVAITASAGDDGYGVEYPAASQYVTAVGGTSLTRSSTSRGWTETAWSGTGSGCSSVDAQPSWQAAVSNITSVCSRRAVADVSAVADPNTGVAVYDSYAYQGASGWLVFGGTSVASPLVASVYALAGNAASVTYGSYPYSHTSSLNAVTSGSNGSCGNRLCKAGTGWDGPTGLGTPHNTTAF